MKGVCRYMFTVSLPRHPLPRNWRSVLARRRFAQRERLGGSGEFTFAAIDFRAKLFLFPLVVRNLFLGVVVELLGNLAADGPDFFERLVTLRFHRLGSTVPTVSPAGASTTRAEHLRGGYARSCLRWPDADSST